MKTREVGGPEKTWRRVEKRDLPRKEGERGSRDKRIEDYTKPAGAQERVRIIADVARGRARMNCRDSRGRNKT